MRLPKVEVKMRSALEWAEILTDHRRWRFSTILSTVGFIGMLTNVVVILASFNHTPRVWKFFCYVTLAGAALEAGQAYIRQGQDQNPIRFSSSSGDELASKRQEREARLSESRSDRSA